MRSLCFFLFCGLAAAQIQTIQNEPMAAARVKINADFNYLDSRSGVNSVAGRNGQVVLTHLDLTDWTAATASFLRSVPVTSVASRTGAIVLTHNDISDWSTATSSFSSGTSLGFTPLNPANNLSELLNKSAALTTLGGVTSAQAAAAAPVQSVATRTGAVTLTHSDLTDWSSTTSSFGNISGTAPTAPSIVARANVTGRTADISATTVYAVPSGSAGMYRISCAIIETTVATTSSTLPACVAGWTDYSSSAVTGSWTSGQDTGNYVGDAQGGVFVMYAKASTNITYNTTGYASVGATAMQFAVRITVEYLGQ